MLANSLALVCRSYSCVSQVKRKIENQDIRS